MSTEWNRRFFESTRGAVVLLLRRGEYTVNELAEQLELTDNAVRAHLAALERDGLVERAGQRRGGGKPAYAYRLTDGARRLFPDAYASILSELLETAADQLGPEQARDLLHATGRRMARSQPPPTGDLAARVDQAAGLITEFGGMAEVAETGQQYEIRGFSCPFGEIVATHPNFCAAVQELLREYIGADVAEHCDRTGSPKCCFAIGFAGE